MKSSCEVEGCGLLHVPGDIDYVPQFLGMKRKLDQL